MAHPVWPAGLPAWPRRGEWKISPKLPPVETDMEGGNTRARWKPGDDVRTITQTLRFSESDYAIWDAFYQANGSGRITMPVFLGTGVLVNKTVQIVGGIKDAAHDGLKYSVPMTLKVYNV